jgi:hypothetical protein
MVVISKPWFARRLKMSFVSRLVVVLRMVVAVLLVVALRMVVQVLMGLMGLMVIVRCHSPQQKMTAKKLKRQKVVTGL